MRVRVRVWVRVSVDGDLARVVAVDVLEETVPRRVGLLDREELVHALVKVRVRVRARVTVRVRVRLRLGVRLRLRLRLRLRVTAGSLRTAM